MPIQPMDIKEIKTKGFERVVHGYHEESNFSAYIAIHTLKNGPAFGEYVIGIIKTMNVLIMTYKNLQKQ